MFDIFGRKAQRDLQIAKEVDKELARLKKIENDNRYRANRIRDQHQADTIPGSVTYWDLGLPKETQLDRIERKLDELLKAAK